MFRLNHLETTFQSRFSGSKPKGSMTAFEEAAAKYLDIAVDTVQKLRKWISACKRGRKSTIADLSASYHFSGASRGPVRFSKFVVPFIDSSGNFARCISMDRSAFQLMIIGPRAESAFFPSVRTHC